MVDVNEDAKRHAKGTAPALKPDMTEAELEQKLNWPKNAENLQEAQDQLERMPVTFSSQLKKAHLQLKQLDSEIMENVNLILASIPQTNMTAHAYQALAQARERREELFKLIKFLGEEINANRDASHAGVPIDSHYL